MSGAARRAAVEVTIVVPTYNECQNVPHLVERIAASLVSLRWEVIVVDDDSPDGTAEIVRRMAISDPRIRCIRRVGRRGLAGACLEGVLAAQADVVVVMDADLQHDAALVPALHAAVADGHADIAVASRFVDGMRVEGLSAERLLSSRLAIAACRTLLGVTITDPLSGFFAARRSVVEAAAPGLSVDGFKILLDIIVSSERRPRLIELPFSFEKRVHGSSKLDARVCFDFVALLLSKLGGGWMDAAAIKRLSIRVVSAIAHMAGLWLLATKDLLSFTSAEIGALGLAGTTAFLLWNALDFSDRRRQGWSAAKALALFLLLRVLPSGVALLASVWIYDLMGEWWLAGLAGAILGTAASERGPQRRSRRLATAGLSPL